MHQHSHDAKQLNRTEHSVVWTAQEGDNTVYVAMFNIGETANEIVVSLNALGIQGQDVELVDLWSGSGTRSESGVIKAEVPTHGAVLYRISF